MIPNRKWYLSCLSILAAVVLVWTLYSPSAGPEANKQVVEPESVQLKSSPAEDTEAVHTDQTIAGGHAGSRDRTATTPTDVSGQRNSRDDSNSHEDAAHDRGERNEHLAIRENSAEGRDLQDANSTDGGTFQRRERRNPSHSPVYRTLHSEDIDTVAELADGGDIAAKFTFAGRLHNQLVEEIPPYEEAYGILFDKIQQLLIEAVIGGHPIAANRLSENYAFPSIRYDELEVIAWYFVSDMTSGFHNLGAKRLEIMNSADENKLRKGRDLAEFYMYIYGIDPAQFE